ncbi:MAG TPA: replication-associated recombination protein A [Chthoniobacter sp.]|nr:replication-associated recombination protein A [Chthoniobacter sp.]
MSDLFAPDAPPKSEAAENAPLAQRMRPRSLDEYAGQQHILAPGKLLRRAIEADRLSSVILFGPPGTGKTTLAEIIASATQSRFERLSGVESNVADLRRVIASATNRLANKGEKTILFIDEIHRWNKAQQDVLLPDVERGIVRLIGATTHNPFYYINSPLVSRSQVFQLEPLTPADLLALEKRALADEERGYGKLKIEVAEEALMHLATVADGDARKCLNALEIAVVTTEADKAGVIHIDRAIAEESIQKKAVVYDAHDDQHYDTISAFIKSVRGSDPDAALYWLAKMLYAGEDIRFLARRLVILASEDIGMADPQGLVVAVAAQQSVEFIGLPEAQIPLAQATVYLATAPKSNRAYAGILAAKKEVQEGVTLAVPKHLRDKSSKRAAKAFGHEGYQYSHDFEGSYVPQAYLPEGRRYYEPSDQGYEKRVKERLDYWRALFDQAQAEGGKGKPSPK